MLSVFLFSNSHQLSPGGHALKLNSSSSSTAGNKPWEMASHQNSRSTSGDSHVNGSSVKRYKVPSHKMELGVMFLWVGLFV